MTFYQTEDDLDGLLRDALDDSPRRFKKSQTVTNDKSLSIILDTQTGDSHMYSCQDCAALKKDLLKLQTSCKSKSHESHVFQKRIAELDKQAKESERLVQSLRIENEHFRTIQNRTSSL